MKPNFAILYRITTGSLRIETFDTIEKTHVTSIFLACLTYRSIFSEVALKRARKRERGWLEI
jgi:hypothetical protein